MKRSRNYFGCEVKIQLVRESSAVQEKLILSPFDAVQLVKDDLKSRDREILLAITLNTRNRVLGVNEVSVGTANESLVHPREVFKTAILQNAVSVILAHNHPSGDTEPSDEDKQATKRIAEAGRVLGIEVLDHIIVGEHYFSFADEGLLKQK